MKSFTATASALIITGLFLPGMVQAQNLETMMIQKIENSSIIIPGQCRPDDMVIVINSSIDDLKFESNMLPDSDFVVTRYNNSNQYIICHERMKFKLAVSGPNLESDNIDIFETDKPQLSYSVTSNIAKGKANIITNPGNSTVLFTSFNNLAFSSNTPVTYVSGKYRINIIKPNYMNVDTTIVIPRNAEMTYNFDLKPLFSKIKLVLKTNDSARFVQPPVMWIDSVKLVLDAFVKPGANQKWFYEGVEFFRFYEGNVVPLEGGTYEIRIESEGYIPFKTTLNTRNGETTTLLVNLEPIPGYVTFIDKQFADGATIYLDNRKIGQVPLFKVKARAGNHKVKFEKPGFITTNEEYNLLIAENQTTDFNVSMSAAKKLTFVTDPPNAEVFMDGERIGFAPFSIVANEGTHNIVIRKNGFAGEKIKKQITGQSPNEEVIDIKLRQNFPLNIRSEQDSLIIRMEGAGDLNMIETDSIFITPATLHLPYGDYRVTLLKNQKPVYRGQIGHNPGNVLRKLPVYSRSSFRVLAGSYIIPAGTGKSAFKEITNAEASFGHINIFPNSGLSTSIFNVDYRVADTMKRLVPNILFLNWDWRIGGAVVRQVDVNLLGRVKYSPGLKVVDLNLPGFTDVDMLSYFYGVEVSTRLSYLNLNFRIGRQVNKGNAHEWDGDVEKYVKDVKIPVNESYNVVAVGFTLGGKVAKSNYLLRMWKRPVF